MKVMSLAFENDYVLEFIQEEIMRLLSKKIEGFNYDELL